ncbi:hypothetical protein FNX48_025550, partial [Streptomyces sp. IF17]|nr:hypothetical protein [Streptomyces alkaliphilus]
MARASDGTGGSSAVFVVTLTAVALAIVGFLAWQAAGAVEPRTDTAAPAGSDAGDGTGDPANTPIGDPADGGDSGDDGAGGDGGASGEDAHPPLPPVSGTGARVVYSLGEQRVWLVETDGTASRRREPKPSEHPNNPLRRRRQRIVARASDGTGGSSAVFV